MKNRRAHARIPLDDAISFTVLCAKSSEFRRIDTAGRLIDASQGGIGVVTDFPLEAGHVVEWNDKHQKGRLHIAMVRWSLMGQDTCRAGLMFI